MQMPHSVHLYEFITTTPSCANAQCKFSLRASSWLEAAIAALTPHSKPGVPFFTQRVTKPHTHLSFFYQGLIILDYKIKSMGT